MEQPSDLRPKPLLEAAGCCLLLRRGSVALCGRDVDAAGVAGSAGVNPLWQRLRQDRDGDGFHVTLFTKADLQSIADRMPAGAEEGTQCLARKAVAAVAAHPAPLRWVDLGEGRARDGPAETVFRVVLWPAGSAARRALGLPLHDFHISLGFHRQDVHNRSKGVQSLASGAPAAEAVPALLELAAFLAEAGTAPELDAEGVEELAGAALLGAAAHSLGDAEAEVHQLLCRLHGRLKRPAAMLEEAELALHARPGDKVAIRWRAFALVMLGRWAEALPELEWVCDQGSDDATEVEQARLQRAVELCRQRLGLPALEGKLAARSGRQGQEQGV